MLNLTQILAQYPPYLQRYRRALLREYLQYKILSIIFNTKYANKLSFLGGTSLRIVYNNARFSEDLDFDNFGITKEEFEDLGKQVKKELELDGFTVEIKNVFKGAYRCYVRIPKILFERGLSPIKEEKIMLQLDTVPHNFDYKVDKKILDKFDIFTAINVTPLDVLLSQKICTAFGRKRTKGRDFYDITFLLGMGVKVNIEYLKKTIHIKTLKELKEYILEKSSEIDFNLLLKDLKPFLFKKEDYKRILLFKEYIEGYEF